MKWYVIQTLSGHENKVKKSLLERKDRPALAAEWIKEIVIPVENISEVKKGERKVVQKKIWSGYVLICMELTEQSWQYVRETDGVIDFLGQTDPTPLPEEEVRAILEAQGEKKEEVVSKHDFAKGDEVRIADGVFASFIGRVEEIFPEKGRLSVTVSIFGRETKVEDLEFWQVESPEEGKK